ncbi:MAG: hypothetical protein IAF94_06640, partial [Pirellulaceae bacterium]|nr:hypothetical protein [Pirellulaceae bacterium]
AAGAAPGIDFLHPRRRPAPQDRRRFYIALGATAAAILLLCAGYLVFDLRQMDARITTLQREKTAILEKNKKGKTIREQAAKVDPFFAADIVWLDELRVISEKAPPPEKARLEKFLAGTRPKAGGGILLDAVTEGPDVSPEFERALRDERHIVSGSGGKRDEKAVGLNYRILEDIVIAPHDPLAPARTAKQVTGAKPPAESKAPAKAAPAKAVPAKAAAKGGGS